MNFLLLAILLFAALLIYLKVAGKYLTKDIPNERSSHQSPTITSGGFILPLGILGWSLLASSFPVDFLIPLLVLALVSLMDDHRPVPALVRFIIQLICVSWCVWMTFSLNSGPVGILIISMVILLLTGWINVFNFMDGINGMSGIYGLITLGTFWFINEYRVRFAQPELIEVSAIALIVFGFFNFRKRALCFAGDVGSITLAFLLGYLGMLLIVNTGNPLFILLFTVFGLDSLLTILERLMGRENIFKPHRKHLYQLLVNEANSAHLRISFVWAILQLLINIGLVSVLWNGTKILKWSYSVGVVLILTSIYLAIKVRTFNVHYRRKRTSK